MVIDSRICKMAAVRMSNSGGQGSGGRRISGEDKNFGGSSSFAGAIMPTWG